MAETWPGGGVLLRSARALLDLLYLGRVNVLEHDAVADAVVLTDATITAGSKILTSAAGQFLPEHVGMIIYVAAAGGSKAALKTTIASYQSATQVTVTATAVANSLVSGGPNVNAIFGTGNAAAFNAAFAEAQAAASPVSNVVSRYLRRKTVFAPEGAYLIEAALDPLVLPGLKLEGNGAEQTRLHFCEAGAMISMGSYTADPTSAFEGTANGFTAKGIGFGAEIFSPSFWIGSRVSTAIQDNGCGEAKIDDCLFQGFKYGFNGAYGSDFTRFSDDVDFQSCDVGAYFGPGSQQVHIGAADFFTCEEDVVVEGAPQGAAYGSSHEDCHVSAFTFEAKATGRTRSGIPVDIEGANYQFQWLVSGSWFESFFGRTLAPRMVWMKGDAPGSTPSGVTIRDAYLVSGGDQDPAGHNCFFELTNTDPDGGPQNTPIIENLHIRGNFINHIFKYSGTGITSAPTIRDTPIPAGSGITYTYGPAGSLYVDNHGVMVGEVQMQPANPNGDALTLLMYGDVGGTSYLMKVRHATDSTFISGIAQAGAFVDAYTTQTLSANGAVTIDASTTNHHAVTLAANATSSSITNPMRGQRLTIEWIEDATGGRTYSWPANCAFATGGAPAVTTANTRRSVTFRYDGTNWREIGRAV